jgi:hypothetical protein
MKKLSEIGTALSRHPVDGGMIPFDPKLEEKTHIAHLHASRSVFGRCCRENRIGLRD